MKKLIFLGLILAVNVAKSQEYSTVYFFPKLSYKNTQYTIYLNENQIGTLAYEENIKLKMLSEGRMTVTIIINSFRVNGVLDVKKGGNYYFQINGVKSKEIEEEEAKKYLSRCPKEILIEEDVNKPIGNLSKSAISSRPKQGSGFLINNQGYIITNFHVIEDAKKIKVRGIKGDFSTAFEAKLISGDRQNDIALLQIQSKLLTFNKPPYNLSDSKKVGKAERVFALGYPFENTMGSEVKITDGIINSLTGFKGGISEFQFSAPIQGGNSGGPLFNSKGELIGIVSAKIRSDVADQVGYAIKSNYLKYFLEESEETEFSKSENLLLGKELPEQVKLISDFVYIIETE